MSAFVVSEGTINSILTAITLDRSNGTVNYQLGKLGYDAKSKESLATLGRDLLNMNIEAVDYRYNENTPKVESFDFHMKPGSVYSQLKNLQCFMYQCAEGGIPENPLYKALQGIEYSWMYSIISDIPQFESAPWGH